MKAICCRKCWTSCQDICLATHLDIQITWLFYPTTRRSSGQSRVVAFYLLRFRYHALTEVAHMTGQVAVVEQTISELRYRFLDSCWIIRPLISTQLGDLVNEEKLCSVHTLKTIEQSCKRSISAREHDPNLKSQFTGNWKHYRGGE